MSCEKENYFEVKTLDDNDQGRPGIADAFLVIPLM